MSKRPTIIIGGGPGGLLAAVLLAKAGKRVLLLEQHHTIGGGLQSFCRGGELFDTGFHYVGAMHQGELLRQIFRYAGLEHLPVRGLDEECFDSIHLGDKSYPLAQGCDRFVERLAERFPHQEGALKRYMALMREVGESVSVEEFAKGHISRDASRWQGVSADELLHQVVDDETLRGVLTGNSMLYGGGADHTSFYDHAMILHSFIAGGAYSFVGGTQQVADGLAESLKRLGGELRCRSRVVGLHASQGRIGWVETADGERIEAEEVISTLHPRHTFALLQGDHGYRASHLKRIEAMADSVGLFTLYLRLRPEAVRYSPCNYYLHHTARMWSPPLRSCTEPIHSLLFTMQPPINGDYASVASLMLPMSGEAMADWEETNCPMQRGADYLMAKSELAQRMVDFAQRWIPSLGEAVEATYTASPLTWRDYTSTPRGSAYGLLKDYHNPIACHLPTRTRLENLFLAGQSVNLHGGLGVALSSVVVCSALVGEEWLTKAIANG